MASSRMPCLVVLLVCGLSFLVEVRAGFVYPRNLEELKGLKDATSVNRPWASDDDRAEDVLDKLWIELRRSQEELDSVRSDDDRVAKQRSERHIALVKSYLRVADVRENRCQESDMSNLVFLINLHSGHDKDLVNYLKHYTWRQLMVCKPKWDRNFESAVEVQLSDKSRSNLLLLIDMLISEASGPATGRSPRRPFQRRLLQRIATRVPRRGLLLFLERTGRLELDEVLSDSHYKDNYEGFLRAVDESLLPTCREVCSKVKPAVSPYSVVFGRDLFEADQVRELFHVSDSGRLMEWMAGAGICCKLVQARDEPGQQRPNLLHETFFELAGDGGDQEQFMSRMSGRAE